MRKGQGEKRWSRLIFLKDKQAGDHASCIVLHKHRPRAEGDDRKKTRRICDCKRRVVTGTEIQSQ